MPDIENQTQRSRWVMRATGFVALPNFFAFFIGIFYFGGDALSGHVQDGHYFLCAHGSSREVAESVWRYSYWHAVTAFAGIMLFCVEAAIFVSTGDIVLRFDRRA